jgi:hypothetical protein
MPANDIVTAVLFIMAVVLAAYVLLIVMLRAVRPLRRAGVHAASGFAAPFSAVFDDVNRESRLGQLEEEVRRALGEDDAWGERERADIVKAAVAAQQINILNQNLRTSVGQCLQTHWAVATGAGATHMSEAARHPLSRQLRQRVMDLSDLLSHKLATYPLLLDSPELIRLQLGLRWIPATCATCPYWTTTYVDAPRVCPTAKAMSRDASTGQSGAVVDAEVVENC